MIKYIKVGLDHTKDFTIPKAAAFPFPLLRWVIPSQPVSHEGDTHSKISKDCLIECLPRQFLVYLNFWRNPFRGHSYRLGSSWKVTLRLATKVTSVLSEDWEKSWYRLLHKRCCNNVAKNGKFWVNNPIIVFFVPSWIMFIRNSRKGHSVPMHLRFGASLCIGTIITMSPNFVVFDIRLFRRGRNGMSECSFRVSRK